MRQAWAKLSVGHRRVVASEYRDVAGQFKLGLGCNLG